MTTRIKLIGLSFLLLVLAGCEQPATESEQAETAPPDESATPAVSADTVTSIDADGNVAPFGMASRQPVPVPEPEPVAAVAESATQPTGASSDLYNVHCVACHGADAKGVQGLGLNLVESQLVASSSEEELAAFLKAGRAADSPDSVSKVPMPGFAWMSDDDLAEITGYLKKL